MNRKELVARIIEKQSVLCIGLDTEEDKVPVQFSNESSPVRAFEQAIVQATQDLAVAYKLNLAFYEARGEDGWKDLENLISFIRTTTDAFIIADAKRGDIGNTARKYAEAYFDRAEVDAVTLSPYMGRDSVAPFLGRDGKWAIVLAVTSNPGAEDLQFLPVGEGRLLYEQVIRTASTWGGPEEMMFVVGATRPELIAEARAIVPEHFLLVPGVGAQGGDLATVLQAGLIQDAGLLVNSSRGILYAGSGPDAIPAARNAAMRMQHAMKAALIMRGIVN
ncbi:MAG: orotidine-5'-phosphate decarboxylase [Flavobacteriales bacterium]|nr:orotidine-5'-phosphate decarboxylase [Flavobacteriales bacterium]